MTDFNRGFYAALDLVANFINSLDSSEMTGRDVRSAIYSECLAARPPATLSRSSENRNG